MVDFGYPGLALVFRLMGYQFKSWFAKLKHWLYFTPIFAGIRREFVDFYQFEPEYTPTSTGRMLVLSQLRTLAAEIALCHQDRQNYSKLRGSNYLNRYYEERHSQSLKGFNQAFRLAQCFGYRYSGALEYTDFVPKTEDPLTLPELYPEYSMALAN